MPKTSKSGPSVSGSVDELSFEAAMKKLESVVDAMESDDLPLEELLSRYEEGARLAAVCQRKLAEADVKIQQLEEAVAGDLFLKPFAAGPADPADQDPV